VERRHLRRHADTTSYIQTNTLVGQYVSLDVTADVAAFLLGTSNFGWMIRKDAEGAAGNVDYTSREGLASQRPRLVLEFLPPTSTPTATFTNTPTMTASHTPTRTFTPSTTPTPTATPTPDPNCGAAPIVNCKQPVQANKAKLLLKNKGGAGDKLVWKWICLLYTSPSPRDRG
jgi:hypothetical protein